MAVQQLPGAGTPRYGHGLRRQQVAIGGLLCRDASAVPDQDGVVQIDDAFLGRERTGGKRGHGSESKGPLVAAVQTTAGGSLLFIRLVALPNWKMRTVARWLDKAPYSFNGVKGAQGSHEAIIPNADTAKQASSIAFNRRFDLGTPMPSLLVSCAFQRSANDAVIRTAMPPELGS